MNTCIIVDDELNAREALKGMLKLYFPEIKVVDEAKNLPESNEKICSLKPDIVFLDIEMPGHLGTEIFDLLPEDAPNFQLVFVTAYAEYAINAFELSATDYLLKPVQREALQRAMSKLNRPEKTQLEALKSLLQPTQNSSKKIAISTAQGTVMVELKDLLYVKADGSYCNIVLKNDKRLFVSKKLLDFERLQEMGPFLRIHRSHIVNLDEVVKLLKTDGGAVVLSNGDELSIASDKKAQIEAFFNHNRF